MQIIEETTVEALFFGEEKTFYNIFSKFNTN